MRDNVVGLSRAWNPNIVCEKALNAKNEWKRQAPGGRQPVVAFCGTNFEPLVPSAIYPKQNLSYKNENVGNRVLTRCHGQAVSKAPAWRRAYRHREKRHSRDLRHCCAKGVVKQLIRACEITSSSRKKCWSSLERLLIPDKWLLMSNAAKWIITTSARRTDAKPPVMYPNISGQYHPCLWFNGIKIYQTIKHIQGRLYLRTS